MAQTHNAVSPKASGRHHDTAEDKLSYLLGFLMSGLKEEGHTSISKNDIRKVLGSKRMSKEAYELIYSHLPAGMNRENIRILHQGSNLTLIDAERLETFSVMLAQGEAH